MSVQDNAVVHVDLGNPATIGNRVTVGHGALVHGCEVAEDCIVGMGAIIGSRATVGRGSILGAGTVIPEGEEIPRDSLVLGVPGKVVRRTEEAHRLRIEASWRVYAELARKTLSPRAEMAGDPAKRVTIEGVPDLAGMF